MKFQERSQNPEFSSHKKHCMKSPLQEQSLSRVLSGGLGVCQKEIKENSYVNKLFKTNL